MNIQPPRLLVSIIIVNYNYARFLKDAINSALQQTYPNIEIIIIDDGSTDTSYQVIDQYRHHAICGLKENSGQASAFNLGFALSRGDWVLFLDADDTLHPNAISDCLKILPNNRLASKVHAPLVITDDKGEQLGKQIPYQTLSTGNLKSHVLEQGPESYVCSPTSGNMWSRYFLSQVFPMPEKYYRTSADAYLFTLAPLFGEILSLEYPIGCYRIHGKNQYWQKTTNQKTLRQEICRFKHRTVMLYKYADSNTNNVNAKTWRLNNRYYLAKVLILCKLQDRHLKTGYLMACIHSSFIAPIIFWKRISWVAWFLALWLTPNQMISAITKPFERLRTRL